MNILLAVDSSEVAEVVVRAAVDQFSRAHGVRVLQAVDWETQLSLATQFAQGPGAADHVIAERDRLLGEARSHVEGLAGRLRAAGFGTVSTETPAEGAPATAILQAAERWPAHLILVGSHGRSAMDRLLLGSVSAHVVGHATCSVEVVRPAR